MYTIDEVKEYISLFEDSSLSVLEVQCENGAKLRLEKPVFAGQPDLTEDCAQTPQPKTPTVSESVSAESAKTVRSPIVGVFYSSPSPGAEPFVSVGTKVKKGSTVCIIEAMKCMNEIQAEEDYEIVDVLVGDGDLVEYDQPLFTVK